jgi:nucleoid-associated protein YgaU
MSGARLLVTGVAMTAVAAVLSALDTDPPTAARTLRAASHIASTAGPDVVVLAAVSLAAWLAWGWGVLGLALTAATALPGVIGAAARRAGRVLLPASLRSGAAVALGIGLVVATPLGAHAAPASALAASGPTSDRPPGADRDDLPVPDWPGTTPDRSHVVAPGDCLWRIAAERLRRAGGHPSDAGVAAAVESWWQANRGVIGADPDLIHPGQVLRPPPTT